MGSKCQEIIMAHQVYLLWPHSQTDYICICLEMLSQVTNLPDPQQCISSAVNSDKPSPTNYQFPQFEHKLNHASGQEKGGLSYYLRDAEWATSIPGGTRVCREIGRARCPPNLSMGLWLRLQPTKHNETDHGS